MAEIARRCFTCLKTTYRHLKVLEDDLDIPIWQDGSKRGITEGYFLPPINFTLEEAINIFLATCLMYNLSSQCMEFVKDLFRCKLPIIRLYLPFYGVILGVAFRVEVVISELIN